MKQESRARISNGGPLLLLLLQLGAANGNRGRSGAHPGVFAALPAPRSALGICEALRNLKWVVTGQEDVRKAKRRAPERPRCADLAPLPQSS